MYIGLARVPLRQLLLHERAERSGPLVYIIIMYIYIYIYRERER